MIKFKRLALLALSTMVLAACGGDIAAPTLPAVTVVPVVTEIPTAKATHYIKAIVSDELLSAEEELRWSAHRGDTIIIEADMFVGDKKQVDWQIIGLPKTKKSYDCALATVELAPNFVIYFTDYRGETRKSFIADGTNGSWCSITVDDVDSNEISGTFEATLREEGYGAVGTHKVTKGSFRVRSDNNPA